MMLQPTVFDAKDDKKVRSKREANRNSSKPEKIDLRSSYGRFRNNQQEDTYLRVNDNKTRQKRRTTLQPTVSDADNDNEV